MRTLSKEAYLSLREGATVVEADSFGDKVLLLKDGSYLKLFRVKRLITSARLIPYSKRFASNVNKLKKLDIATVSVIDLFKIPTIERTAVHYSPLAGNTLRNLPDGIDKYLAEKLGQFIRELHDKGVYFRSLHLGNIVLTPQNKLGLIDVADMSFYKHPLSSALRLRNFHHLCRYDKDREGVFRELKQFNTGLDDLRLSKKLQPLFETSQFKNQLQKENDSHKNHPKKVVVQVRQTTVGLMESTNQFLQSFDRKHYHIVVIFLKGSLSEGKRKRVAADEVIFLNLSDRALLSLRIFAVHKIHKLIKNYNPTVLFAHRYHAIWLSGVASIFTKIPICFAVLHGNNQINKPSRRLFTRVFLKNRFYFIGISNVVRQDLLTSDAGLQPGRVFSTPNALNIETQQEYLLPKDAARKKLRIPSDRYIIGHIGRLTTPKNQQHLLKSFAEAYQASPRSLLVIIGDGGLESKLKLLAFKLNIEHAVLFLGNIDRAADYMAAFDLFVMTSNDEGFGRVLLEAMVARVPIIATDIPAFVEVLGGSRSLVRPDDIKALSKKILGYMVMNSNERDLILADQDFVLYDKFCIEKFKLRFNQIYQLIQKDQHS